MVSAPVKWGLTFHPFQEAHVLTLNTSESGMSLEIVHQTLTSGIFPFSSWRALVLMKNGHVFTSWGYRVG